MRRADFDAEIVSNTIPDVVTSGQNVEATVITVKNNGKVIFDLVNRSIPVTLFKVSNVILYSLKAVNNFSLIISLPANPILCVSPLYFLFS